MDRSGFHIHCAWIVCAAFGCSEFPTLSDDVPSDAPAADAVMDAFDGPGLVDDVGADLSDPEPDVTAECQPGVLSGCPELLGARAIDCVDDQCLYVCESGFADRNGDITLGTGGNGCECSGVEVCNGLDDDCDGQIDEGVSAGPCPAQMGVCVGAVATCTQRECNAEIYDAARENEPYIEGFDGLCDGLDNDCNGRTDELCCQSGFLRPAAPLVALRQVRPDLAVSPEGEMLVVWEETRSGLVGDQPASDTQVRYRWLDAALDDIGGPGTLVPPEGFAHWPHVHWDGLSFVLTFATTSATETRIHRSRISPQGDIQEDAVLAASPVGTIGSLSAAGSDRVSAAVWVTNQPEVCGQSQRCVVADFQGETWDFAGRIGGSIPSDPVVAFGHDEALVAFAEADGGRRVVWTVMQRGGPVSPQQAFNRDNLGSAIRPKVTATNTGWALGYAIGGEDDRYVVRALDRQGVAGPEFQVYTENTEGHLVNLSLGWTPTGLAVVFDDSAIRRLEYVLVDLAGRRVVTQRTLLTNRRIPAFSTRLARHPQAGFVGAVSSHSAGEGTPAGQLDLFWIDPNGATVCRP